MKLSEKTRSERKQNSLDGLQLLTEAEPPSSQQAPRDPEAEWPIGWKWVVPAFCKKTK